MKTILAGTREHARILLPWNAYPSDFRAEMRQWINDDMTEVYKKLIALRKREKALIYGDFEVIDDTKDRFVYSRSLDGTTFVIDCNLGKKERKAYLPTKEYKAIFLSRGHISHKLMPYEARIWKKK